MEELEVIDKNRYVSKSIGLLDRRIKKPIFFMTRFGIHTFLLKHDIQVLILDEKCVVIKNVVIEPNKLFFWNPCHHRIVEIALIKGKEPLKISVGEKLDLRFV